MDHVFPSEDRTENVLEAASQILSLSKAAISCVKAGCSWSTRDSGQLGAGQRWGVSRDRALRRGPSSPEDAWAVSGQDGEILKNDSVSLGKVSPC